MQAKIKICHSVFVAFCISLLLGSLSTRVFAQPPHPQLDVQVMNEDAPLEPISGVDSSYARQPGLLVPDTALQIDKVAGIFRWPIPGYITQGFSINHNGIDIVDNAGRCGVPIAALYGSTVVKKGYDSIGGNWIILYVRDGFFGQVAMYLGHMLNPSFRQVGERVPTGAMVGLVGRTGVATGCHVHFTLKESVPRTTDWGRPFFEGCVWNSRENHFDCRVGQIVDPSWYIR